jgi:RNA polymerase sigma-70 factor (ECF subfamily)
VERVYIKEVVMASFSEVYGAEYRRLVAELFAMTGSLAEAEDLVQEAFGKALARWERVGQLEVPVAWIRRVALNAATSRWRSLRRRSTAVLVLVPDEGQPPPEPVMDLIAALAGLPVAQREAIVLHHLTGLSVEEIARRSRCSESTVKSRLQRGRARLAVLLADESEEVSRP